MDIRICKECGFILGTRPNSKDYCNYYYNEQYLADLTLRGFMSSDQSNSHKWTKNQSQKAIKIILFIFWIVSKIDNTNDFKSLCDILAKLLFCEIIKNIIRNSRFFLGILEFHRIFMSVQPFSSLALISSLIALVFISSRQRLFLLPLQPSQEQGTHSQLA